MGYSNESGRLIDVMTWAVPRRRVRSVWLEEIQQTDPSAPPLHKTMEPDGKRYELSVYQPGFWPKDGV